MNKTEAFTYAAIAAFLLASSLSWKFLALASILAILYPLAAKVKMKTGDHAVLACAKELRDSCKRRGLSSSMLHLSNSSTCPVALKSALRAILMGNHGKLHIVKSGNDNLDELIELISSASDGGFDVKNSLDIYISKLESEMDLHNSAMQGSLNMNTLSQLGVNFFVPLFGGIGASIMSSSTSILGSLHPPTIQFELLIVLYSGMMSFVMSIFGSGSAADNAGSALRSAVIAGGIIKASAALMAYAI